MQQEELLARAAKLTASVEAAEYDWCEHWDHDAESFARYGQRKLEEVERELAEFRSEDVRRSQGLPDAHYVLTVTNEIVRPNWELPDSPPTYRVQCPSCSQVTGLRLHAITDREHTNYISCDNGHQWNDPLVGYVFTVDYYRFATRHNVH